MRGRILSAPVQRFGGNSPRREQDLLAVEEPLQIRLGERDVSITMRTPGNDAELAVGFLFTEGILESAADIARIDCGENQVDVTLGPGVEIDAARLQRNFYTTSSCGVCGKASIEALALAGCAMLPRGIPQVAEYTLHSLPAKIREAQALFDRTGGLHAAALCSAQGELIAVREDVGRHNAVDKLVGWAVMEGAVPLRDRIVVVSGRASFELVQKSAMAGIPILAAVGAPSSLAVKTALRFGMTLIGFLRQERFNVYAGADRIRGGEGERSGRRGVVAPV
ncbi:MAG TPA: formate dehydrogenase accessory sulfurtransferase FdhD [Bryobacteraceae bacterium]|nr:formate dehydrogenase accessory sulfurtransferase FdhD [Bryobacteraceae bacterium]